MIRRLAIFLVVLTTFCISTSYGQTGIRQSEDWLVKSRQHSHLKTLAEHLDFPDTPISKGAVVAMTIGASTGEILVVGPVAADAKKYGMALSDTAKELGIRDPVEWSQEDDCSAAQLSWGFGHWAATSGGENIKVGQLIARLHAIEPQLSVSLRVPKYIELKGSGEPGYVSSSNRYYDLGKVEPTYVAQVSASIPPWMPIAIYLFMGLVPVCGMGGILLGIAVARRESIPVARRRKLYSKFVYYGSTGSIFVHMPLAMGLMFTGQLRPIADLWFGSVSTASAFTPFLLGPLLIFLPVLAIANPLERKLFGPTPADGSTGPMPPPIIPGQQYLAKQKLILSFSLLGFGILLWVVSLFFSPKSDVVLPLRILGILLVLLRRGIVALVFHRSDKQFPSLIDDESLQAEVSDLALNMGVQFRSVKLDTSAMGHAVASASVTLAGDVRMSVRARDLLDAPERAFILAHELAHLKLNHGRHRRNRMWLPCLVLCAPVFVFPFLVLNRVPLPGGPALFLLPMFLFIPYSQIVGRRMMKRHEYEADKLAWETTGDLASAESALRKLMVGSPMPHLHDMDENATHPAMWRRIENLRKIAGVA